MPKNKFVISFFLFFAWTIIFAHSIIPHNHHVDNLPYECNHAQAHNTSLESNNVFFHGDIDFDSHTCHFHVDLLTQISVDHGYIASSELQSLGCFTSVYKIYFAPLRASFDNPFLDNNHLRAPPQFV